MKELITEIYTICIRDEVKKSKNKQLFDKQYISDLLCSVFASNGNIIEKTNESFDILQNSITSEDSEKYKYLLKPTFLSSYSQVEFNLKYKKAEFEEYYNFLDNFKKELQTDSDTTLYNTIDSLIFKTELEETFTIKYRFKDLFSTIIINLLSLTIDFGSQQSGSQQPGSPQVDSQQADNSKLIEKIKDWEILINNEFINQLLENKISGNTSTNNLDLSDKLLDKISSNSSIELTITELQYAMKKLMINISTECTDKLNNYKPDGQLDYRVNNLLQHIINGISEYNINHSDAPIYIKGGLAYKINELENPDIQKENIFNKIIEKGETISDIDTSVYNIETHKIENLNEDVYKIMKDNLNMTIPTINEIKNKILKNIFGETHSEYYEELKNKIVVKNNKISDIRKTQDSTPDEFSFLSVNPIHNSMNSQIIIDNYNNNILKTEDFSLMRLFNKYKFISSFNADGVNIKLDTKFKFFFELFDLSVGSNKSILKYLSKTSSDIDLIIYNKLSNLPIMSDLFFIMDFNALRTEFNLTKKHDLKEEKRLDRCFKSLQRFEEKELTLPNKTKYFDANTKRYFPINFNFSNKDNLNSNKTTLIEQLLYILNEFNIKFSSDTVKLQEIKKLEDKILKYFDVL